MEQQQKNKSHKSTIMTAKEIIDEINIHLANSNKQYYSDFYIGITNDIDRRLFQEHNVSKLNDWWIFRQANDKATAQSVEEFFLNQGMKGDTGGGSDDSTYVYCYEITNSTIE